MQRLCVNGGGHQNSIAHSRAFEAQPRTNLSPTPCSDALALLTVSDLCDLWRDSLCTQQPPYAKRENLRLECEIPAWSSNFCLGHSESLLYSSRPPRGARHV